MEKVLEKNKDVIVNFGLIACGKLGEIEKLQHFIMENLKDFKVVYQTVSAKRLFLVKKPVRGGAKSE